MGSVLFFRQILGLNSFLGEEKDLFGISLYQCSRSLRSAANSYTDKGMVY